MVSLCWTELLPCSSVNKDAVKFYVELCFGQEETFGVLHNQSCALLWEEYAIIFQFKSMVFILNVFQSEIAVICSNAIY